MATFYVTYDAAAQSSNAVKLIRSGYLFSGSSPNVITGTWDSGNGYYKFALDDTTHVDDYYRIEDGSGNIVVQQFAVKKLLQDAATIPDKFVKNDADDTIIGELAVKPASGTDTQLRIGRETGTQIEVIAENAAASADRNLILTAGVISLQNKAAAAIKIQNVAAGTASSDVIIKSQLDAVKGAGWTAENLKDHETRISGLEGGTGSFSAASINFAGNGVELGIRCNWAMNNSSNAAAVRRYELYVSSSQLAGYSAGTENAAAIAAVQAGMQNVPISAHQQVAFVNTNEDLYVIVLAYDYTAGGVGGTTCIGSTQTLVASGNRTGSLLAIAPSATVMEALARFDAVLDAVRVGGYIPRTLYNGFTVDDATGGSDGAALIEHTETTGGDYIRLRLAMVKDSIYKKLRVVVQGKSSSGSGVCTVVCSTVNGNAAFSVSSYTLATIELDLTTLADGYYEAQVKWKGSGAGTQTLQIIRAELLPVLA